MNKRIVDEEIAFAYDALKDSGIAEHNTIDKKFRSQISSFGAAVITGSILSAVAFFSDKGSTDVNRKLLMDTILIVLKKRKICDESIKNLYEYVNKQTGGNEYKIKEQIIDAAIAVKLAMNLYTLK